MRFAELIELFDRWNVQNLKPRTAEFYRERLQAIARQLGDLPAEDVRPHHLLPFKATWHLILSVQRLYRWAVDEMDLMPVNPMLKLKRPRLGSRRRVLTPAELARLLRGARPDFRRYLLFACQSAARPQELCGLRWEHLQWEGGLDQLGGELAAGRAFFSLADYKGRDRRQDSTAARIIPITPRLGRSLWRALRTRPLAGPVLVTAAGCPWNRNSSRMRIRRLVPRVNVDQVQHGEKICNYTLRHSAATSLAARGLQTSVLQTLLGHSNIKTTQRYVHLAKHQLLNTWERFQKNPRRAGDR